MTEIRKESLSALIDGEANELEVHRLVREFREDDSLTRSWAVYQQIRSTVSTSRDVLSTEKHELLFSRISEAVADEDDFNASGSVVSSGKKLALGSLALAASMTLAVFVGLQQTQTGPTAATPALAESREAVTVQPVAHSQAPELVELDEEKQRRLKAYLNQHDRMARGELNRQQQFVNYPPNTTKQSAKQ